MQYLIKNRIVIGLAALIFVILVVVGGYLVLSKSKDQIVNNTPQVSEVVAQNISPKDLGMVVTVRSDNNAVKFKLNNAKDINNVEYQITYNYDLDGERLENGLFGEMNIAKDGITETDYREFGTCSHGVCRYDKNVSDVKIVAKIVKKDGNTYSLEQPVTLHSTQE